MSTDAVRQFLTKVANEEALQNQAKAIARRKENPADAAVKLGSEHGFEFTRDEFKNVVDTARASRQGQLSEAQLEGVAGGASEMYLKGELADAGGLFLGSSVDGKGNDLIDPPQFKW